VGAVFCEQGDVMWDNTDKQDEGYTDYITDLSFLAVGFVVIVAILFIGWMIW